MARTLAKGRAFGSRQAPQLFAHDRAGTCIRLAIVQQLVGPMRADGDGVDFVGQSRSVDFAVHVPGFLSFLDHTGQYANPFAHDGRDAIAHGAGPAVEFKGSGGKETASGEDARLDVAGPQLDQLPQARHSSGRSKGGTGHLFDEDLTGRIDGGQLQILLGTEVREEPALAHVKSFGQRPDRKSTQTVDGSDIDGLLENGFAGTQSARLAAGGAGGSGSCGAGGHEGTIARKIK